MKNLILSLFMVGLSSTMFGQYNDPVKNLQYASTKMLHANTDQTISLICGVTSTMFYSQYQRDTNDSRSLAISGILGVSSVVFMISSFSNERKGRKALQVGMNGITIKFN
jgi:hypothetical protein